MTEPVNLAATVPPAGATVPPAAATVPPAGATVLTPGATVLTPGATVPTADVPAGPLGQLQVCDIVDLLLLALVRHKASAVTIEPAGPGHAIRYERGTSTVTLDTLTPERGDAVVMRLAIIFGIAVGSAEEQIGRLRIRGRRRGSDPDLPTPPATEILVAVRPTASGLSAELHRFAGPEDEVAGGELVPAASDGGPEGNRRIGPYRISTELGRGSMGIVYRAEHLVLQKAVAIKILHPGMAGDPEAAARFIMEARAACRARHPGIVDVTDFGRLPGGRAFLVMELVEGPTLDVVLQSGPLAPVRAIRIAAAVAEALRAASAHCVVHREQLSARSATKKLKKSPLGNGLGTGRVAPRRCKPRAERAVHFEVTVVGPRDQHLPGSPRQVSRPGRAAQSETRLVAALTRVWPQ